MIYNIHTYISYKIPLSYMVTNCHLNVAIHICKCTCIYETKIPVLHGQELSPQCNHGSSTHKDTHTHTHTHTHTDTSTLWSRTVTSM